VQLPGKNLAAPDISWYYDEMLLQGNTNDVHLAWYMVIEALVLTGEFDKAWQKVNNYLPPEVLANSDDDDFLTQVKILRLISGFYSGNIRLHQARQIFAELNAKPLNTIVQNYFSILLLTLKKNLFARTIDRKETDMLIEQLIKKTGFVYFYAYEIKLQRAMENYLMDINGKNNF
jgi:hypothetical protein